MTTRLRIALVSAFAISTLVVSAQEQELPASAESAPASPAQPSSIPLTEIALRAEELTGTIRRVESLLQPNSDVVAIEAELAHAASVLSRLQIELDAIDANRVSPRILEDRRLAWTEFDDMLEDWVSVLQDRWEKLTHERDALREARAVWEATGERAVREERQVELIVLVDTQVQRIDETVSRLAERVDAVGAELARVSQGREISSRAIGRLANIASEVRGRIWNRDAPPLWRFAEAAAGTNVREAAAQARHYWWETLESFVAARQGKFLFLLACFLTFLGAALLARRTSRSWPPDDHNLDDARFVVSRYLSTAVAFTVLTMVFVLDNTVGPVQDIIIVLAVVPVARLGAGLIPVPARVALHGATILLVLNRLWTLAPDGAFLRRAMLIIVTTLAVAAAIALLLRWRRVEATKRGPWWRLAWLMVAGAVVLLLMSLVASILGWSRLAQRITDGTIESGWGAMAWLVMVFAVVGLVPLAVRSPLGAAMPSLRRHNQLYVRLTFGVSALVASWWWARGMLRQFQLYEPFRDRLTTSLAASVTVGGLDVSAGRVVAAVLILVGTWLLARAVRFLLREEILPRLTLPAGADHSVVSVGNYVIWGGGVLLSAAAAGLSGTQLTVVFGALGVGIGFGLQNIVSNFVSGLILIFERPIKVGDRVQTRDHFGIITGIGIRASTIRTFDGAEVVVPNGDLVSKEFVNWTRTDMTRRIEVLVHVALGSDPKKVLQILHDTAASHPKTLDDPPPSALMVGFGESALDFRLLVWCPIDDFMTVSSDLHVTVNDELNRAGIKIPFPQRDLYVHPSANEEAPPSKT